jgi:ribosomal protein S18 acetylase RimI-like enzyme
MPTPVILRPQTQADDSFLFELYASTREEETAAFGFNAEQNRQFLRSQFELQAIHYQRHYEGASFNIIEVNGEAAGKLYVHRGAGEWRVMDIALSPLYRYRGAGTSLLRSLLADADRAGVPVTIHVEEYNRARRLYERLGFRTKEQQGMYLLLERARRAAPLQEPGITR